MKSITAFNQTAVLKRINKQSTVIDATVGNGHDTVLLARHASEVHGFDVQEEAIEKTRQRLKEEGISNVTLHLESHHLMDQFGLEDIDAIMFNFGYLPGGDKTFTTKKETSLIALEKACRLLSVGGLITLALYPGHKEGKEEATSIKEYVKTLPKTHYDVVSYKPLNRVDAPCSIIIEKRKD
ncbi:MAG: class I SAM-dependent methyltransferase [Bacillota bacterium]